MKSVAIIGAGAAGLCCARHFGGNPAQFKVQVFEKGSEVGGTWIYESSSSQGLKDVREKRSNAAGDVPVADVHSSMYKNLRYISESILLCMVLLILTFFHHGTSKIIQLTISPTITKLTNFPNIQ